MSRRQAPTLRAEPRTAPRPALKSARPTLALPLWGLWGLGTANWPKRAEAITELEAVVDDLHDIMELLEKEEGVEK